MIPNGNNKNGSNKVFSYISQQFIDLAHISKSVAGDLLICHELKDGYSAWHEISNCPAIPHMRTQTGLKDDPVRHPHEISHRTIMPSELIFEIDNDDYYFVRDNSRQLTAYLKSESIPFYNVWSGNHSYHIHVFADFTGIPLDQKMFAELKSLQVDHRRVVRKFLWSKILEEAQLDEDIFDKQPVMFSSYLKGHMIRMQGMRRPDGNYASVIDTIPDEKPVIPVPQFLNAEPKKWSIVKYQDDIMKVLREAIEKAKENTVFSAPSFFKDQKIPCLTALLNNGAKKGKRNAGLFNTTLLSKMVGYTFADTKNNVKEFLDHCEDKDTINILNDMNKVAEAFNSSYHFSCNSLREQFGEGDNGYCQKDKCPVHKDRLDRIKLHPQVDYMNQAFCFRDGDIERCKNTEEFYNLVPDDKKIKKDDGSEKTISAPKKKHERVCLIYGIKLQKWILDNGKMQYRAVNNGIDITTDNWSSFLKILTSSIFSQKEKNGIRQFMEKYKYYNNSFGDYDKVTLPLMVVDNKLIVNYEKNLNTADNLKALNEIFKIVTNQRAFSITLALSVMSPLSYYFRAKSRVFPILVFDGKTEAGKSSLQELFTVKGLDIIDKKEVIRRANSGKSRKSGDTEFTVRESANKHLTIMMLEEIDQQWIEENTEFFKDIATSTGTIRKGTKDLNYYQFEFYPALFCNTNFIDTIPDEIKNRIIEVKFDETNKKRQSSDWFMVESKLESGFLFDFFKELSTMNIDQLLTEQAQAGGRKDQALWYLKKGYEVIKRVYEKNGVECEIEEPKSDEQWSNDKQAQFEGAVKKAIWYVEKKPDTPTADKYKDIVGITTFRSFEKPVMWLTSTAFGLIAKDFNIKGFDTLEQIAGRFYPSDYYKIRRFGKTTKQVLVIPLSDEDLDSDDDQEQTVEFPAKDEIVLTKIQQNILKVLNDPSNKNGISVYKLREQIMGDIDYIELDEQCKELMKIGFIMKLDEFRYKVNHYNLKVFVDNRHEVWSN